MDSPKENFDVDDILNKTVIDCVKEYPSLHYTNVFTESDEKCWDEIAKNTGLQSEFSLNGVFFFFERNEQLKKKFERNFSILSFFIKISPNSFSLLQNHG